MIESLEASPYLPYIQLAMVALFFFALFGFLHEKDQQQTEPLESEQPKENEESRHDRSASSEQLNLNAKVQEQSISTLSEKLEKGTIETGWYCATNRKYI